MKKPPAENIAWFKWFAVIFNLLFVKMGSEGVDTIGDGAMIFLLPFLLGLPWSLLGGVLVDYFLAAPDGSEFPTYQIMLHGFNLTGILELLPMSLGITLNVYLITRLIIFLRRDIANPKGSAR